MTVTVLGKVNVGGFCVKAKHVLYVQVGRIQFAELGATNPHEDEISPSLGMVCPGSHHPDWGCPGIRSWAYSACQRSEIWHRDQGRQSVDTDSRGGLALIFGGAPRQLLV